MPKEAKTESFEQLYARLEESVARLERGGLPLDEAIALYEQGMTLARQCQERLDGAELKITKLKESFALIQPRANGAAPEDPAEDYEYVPEGEPPDDDDRFG
jgi:exodeoxyribonuclease VII small subunit